MRFNHTVAFALVTGWLLLAPPHGDVKAPLSQWTLVPDLFDPEPFPCEAQCLTARNSLGHSPPKGVVANTLLVPILDPKTCQPIMYDYGWYWAAPSPEFETTRCVSADDARLKDK